jgi:TIR domain
MLWDVFISHASEDKASVARPLAEKLQKAGVRVWLDEAQLRLGDSLRAKIDEGLGESRFGVVILSPAFFAKDWPQRELGALFSRQNAILPVWHQLRAKDVAAKSPLLADLLAASTDEGLDAVAAKILRSLRPSTEARPYTSDLAVNPQRVHRALQALEHLSRPTTWPRLAVTEETYPLNGWMGSKSTTLVETLYAFYAPVVEYQQMSYAVRRNFSLLSTASRVQFGLLESAAEAIFKEDWIAAIDPSIEYAPRVPGWRAKRVRNPQKYWWQGISEDRFREAVPFFLRATPAADDPLVTPDEFHATYQRVFASGDVKVQQTLGLLANGFYGFTPATRPVLWRVCVVLAILYATVAGNSVCDLAEVRAEGAEALFQARDETAFPFAYDNTAGLYEDYGVTMRVARQYLATIAVPRLRTYLKGPREQA